MITKPDPPGNAQILGPEAEKVVALIQAHLGLEVRQDRSVEHTLAAGRKLIFAKKNKAVIPHGAWLPFLAKIPLERTQAHMLMKIAEHPILSNVEHAQHLPASWATLIELARLPDEVLEAKLADGTINPEMTREAAKALRSKISPEPSTPQTDVAYKAYAEAKKRGEPIPGKKEFARKLGISHMAMEKGIDRWRREQARQGEEAEGAAEKIEDEVLRRLDAMLSGSERQRVQKAVAAHRAKLDREHAKRVKTLEYEIGVEVRRRIDAADDAVRQHQKELSRENLFLRQSLGRSNVFTEQQFRKLLMCAHPDNSASVTVRNEMMDLLNKNKGRLVKPDDVKSGPKPRASASPVRH